LELDQFRQAQKYAQSCSVFTATILWLWSPDKAATTGFKRRSIARIYFLMFAA
jgi:hypothetical protein